MKAKILIGNKINKITSTFGFILTVLKKILTHCFHTHSCWLIAVKLFIFFFVITGWDRGWVMTLAGRGRSPCPWTSYRAAHSRRRLGGFWLTRTAKRSRILLSTCTYKQFNQSFSQIQSTHFDVNFNFNSNRCNKCNSVWILFQEGVQRQYSNKEFDARRTVKSIELPTRWTWQKWEKWSWQSGVFTFLCTIPIWLGLGLSTQSVSNLQSLITNFAALMLKRRQTG